MNYKANIVLLCLFLSSVVYGTIAQNVFAQDDLLESLEYMQLVELPGEQEAPPKVANGSKQRLMGQKIVSLELQSAVMGFDPILDSGLEVGQTLSPDLLRAATEKLWSSGLYRNIQILGTQEKDGVALYIVAEPMLRMGSMNVQGNNAIDKDQIAREIKFIPGMTIVPDRQNLITIRDTVTNAYFDIGYQEAMIKVSLEATETPGVVTLVIEIVEGPPQRYKNIQILGLTPELPLEWVMRQIDLKEGMIRNPERIEQAVTNLAELLAKANYFDARIGTYQEQRTGSHEWALVIPVQTGIQTSIAFKGNDRFLSSVLRKILIDKVSIFRTSAESLDQAFIRLKDLYRITGYFHAQLSLERFCIHNEGMVALSNGVQECEPGTWGQDLVVTIKEGPLVEIEKIEVIGNRFFSDKDLTDEIHAFMRENAPAEGAFVPSDTSTADDIGLSDKRPGTMKGPRGIRTPKFNPKHTYVPSLYEEATEHLTNVYLDKGFLSASVEQTCNIAQLKATTHKGMEYYPFRLSKDPNKRSRNGVVPCLLISKDLTSLIVRIHVREGIQTKFSEINFEGNASISSAELIAAIQLFPEAPYNELEIRKAPLVLEDLYKNHGYMFVKVTWKRSFSPDRRDAKVVFEINEGPQVTIGKIYIEGAAITSHRLIRERLVFKPGSILTPEVMDESTQRLMALGILAGVNIHMVLPEESASVKDIEIVIEEGKQQYLELRGGLATVEGIRAGFEYGYKNLGGIGMTARFRARANYRLFFPGNPGFEDYYKNELTTLEQLERHILLGLSQPHLLGTKGLIGWSIDFVNERVNEPSFSADRIAGSLTLRSNLPISRKYRRALTVELGTGVEWSDLYAPQGTEISDPEYQDLLRMPDGRAFFSVTRASTVFDFRDHPFMPTKGLLLSLSADYVKSIHIAEDGTEGEDEINPIVKDSNFIRALATLSGYIPLSTSKLVLALSATGGYIKHLTDKSNAWPDRYFYVGGVKTLRGFPEESLVPQDIYETWESDPALREDVRDEEDAPLSEYRGGQVMVLLRSELRYQMTDLFMGAVFFEAGNLWREQKNWTKSFTLRPVAGLGIHFITPVGPVSFDVGINLNQRVFHEKRFAVFFSIGSAF